MTHNSAIALEGFPVLFSLLRGSLTIALSSHTNSIAFDRPPVT